jgi:hypothetical protein
LADPPFETPRSTAASARRLAGRQHRDRPAHQGCTHRHPWSLTSLHDAQFGPNALRHFKQSLTAVAGTRLPAARFELIAAIDDYVSGHALHAVECLARARAAEADPGMAAAAVAYGLAQLQTGDYP